MKTFVRAFGASPSSNDPSKRVFTYECNDQIPEPLNDEELCSGMYLGIYRAVKEEVVACIGVVYDHKGMHYSYADGSVYLLPQRGGFWESGGK